MNKLYILLEGFILYLSVKVNETRDFNINYNKI